MDVMEELNEAGVAKFQGFIGMFCWMVELEQIDIYTEVSQLSIFKAIPRAGHLKACYSIFADLRKHLKMSILFHPSHIRMREDRFRSQDWRDFDGDAKEELPPDMPELQGEPVK